MTDPLATEASRIADYARVGCRHVAVYWIDGVPVAVRDETRRWERMDRDHADDLVGIYRPSIKLELLLEDLRHAAECAR